MKRQHARSDLPINVLRLYIGKPSYSNKYICNKNRSASCTLYGHLNSPWTIPSASQHFSSLAAGSTVSRTPLPVPSLSKRLVQKYAINNTIVVSFANAHHIEYALNWVTYLYVKDITNYLIGAVDPNTADALSAAGVNCFRMYDNAGAADLPEGTA